MPRDGCPSNADGSRRIGQNVKSASKRWREVNETHLSIIQWVQWEMPGEDQVKSREKMLKRPFRRFNARMAAMKFRRHDVAGSSISVWMTASAWLARELTLSFLRAPSPDDLQQHITPSTIRTVSEPLHQSQRKLQNHLHPRLRPV